MAKYFLDMQNGRPAILDLALSFSDLEAARNHVKQALIDEASQAKSVSNSISVRIDVRNEEGVRVLIGTLLIIIDEVAGD